MNWLRALVSGEEDGTKKKRYRKPNKSATEKVENEKSAYIQWAKRHNRPLYERMMQELCGLQEKPDNLAITLKTVRDLQGSGFFPKDPRDLDDDDAESKRILVQGIGGLLQGFVQAQNQPRAPMLSQPQAEYTPPPTNTEQPAIAPPSRVQQEERPMGLIERTIKAQLETKTPEEAAKWFLAQTHPTAKDIVRAFCDSSDAGIPQLLDDLAQQAPDFAGLIAWLKSRDEWLLETVRHLRRLSPAAMGL